MAITAPSHLHVLELYEYNPTQLSWNQIPAAEGYELDAVYDTSFDGRPWADMGRGTWDKSRSLSWNDIHALPAKRLTWDNVGFLDETWADAGAKEWDWKTFGRQPTMFTICRGLGIEVQGPDQGLAWDDLQELQRQWTDFGGTVSWLDFHRSASVGLTWEQQEPHTWNMFESMRSGDSHTWKELMEIPARGLCWDSAESFSRRWADLGGATWHEFYALVDNKAHIAHTVDIPDNKKTARFRVRAYDGKDYSVYFTSDSIPIIPVLLKDDSILLSVLEDEEYLIQLHVHCLNIITDKTLTFEFDPAMISIEKVNADYPIAIATEINEENPIELEVVSAGDGKIQMEMSKPFHLENIVSGFVTLLHIKALDSGDTRIIMH